MCADDAVIGKASAGRPTTHGAPLVWSGIALLLISCAAAFAQVAPRIPGLDPVKRAAQTGRGGRPAPAPPRPAGEKPAEKPAASNSPRNLKFPPLHTVQPPKLVTATLPNGLRLYLAEERELPVFGGVVLVRTGSALDPPERIGLARIAGYLVRQGGTRTKTAEKVDEALSQLGMTLDSEFGDTAGVITFSGLERNAEPSLVFLREILTQPEFRQDRLDQAKGQLRDRIAHRNDDLDKLATRELSSLIFGKDSPYGWQPEYAGLARITRTDLLNFQRRYFFPANLTIGIWGDFDAPRMKTLLETTFGDWSATQPPVPDFPQARDAPAPGIYLGDKKDAPETHLAVGQPGGKVADKDYAALEVMGLMFNRLQARITRDVRAQLGSAISSLRGVSVDGVTAAWGAGFDHRGVFRIVGNCRGAATAEAIQAIQQDIQAMRTREPEEDELRDAKETAVSTLTAAWDTRAEAFQRAMLQEYYGLPRDFAQQHQAALLAVTRADVLRVAKQYLNPDSLTTVVIGNPQVFSTPLEKLNPRVNAIDLTIPEAGPAATPATDASLAEGKRYLERAQAAVGGADKLAAVKDYVIVAEYQLDPSVANLGGQAVPQTDRWIAPTIFRQDLSISTGHIAVYSDGRSGWISAPQGWGALVGPQRKQLESDLFRSYFRFLLSDRIEGRTVNAVDKDLVEITDTTGQLARLEFDPATGLPRRVTYDTPQQAGAPLYTEETYGDYREIGGIKFPFKTVITQAGKKFADVVVTDCKLNTGLRQMELALRPQ